MSDPIVQAALTQGRAWLSSVRNADGSWGYRPGSAGAVEPTVLAAAAGLPLAADWLARTPRQWAHLLLPAVAWPSDPALCNPTLDWIETTNQHAAPIENPEVDYSIPAWGWVSGTSAWVEPTSYAILSLARSGRAANEPAASRVRDGRKTLAVRQCVDGGWNFGNPRMLGTELEAQLPTTGWAVLALDRTADAASVERGLHYLQLALELPSALALSMALLAHVGCGADGSAFAQALVAHMTPEGVRGRVELTGVTCAALSAFDEGAHVFWP